MTRHRRLGAGAPGWWPEGEPWPPHGQRWRGRRAGFVRRIALAFSVLFILSSVGAYTIVTGLLGRFGVGAARQLLPLTLIAAGTLVLLVVAFFTAMRRFGLPLGDLVGAAERVASGDFTTRMREQGPPALRSVAQAFNGMTARLAAHERQRHQLMTDVAHELRTPLTVLQARLEGLLDGVYPRDDAQLKSLLAETTTLGRLIEDVRTLAHTENGTLTLEKEPVDVAALIEDAVDGLRAAEPAAAIRTDVPALPTLEVDPVRIREILVNVLTNAVRHSGGGPVTVTARAADAGVEVTVMDEGPGLGPEELAHVFERFYKGRASTGSGLGLTIARSLARAHGGDLTATSQPGTGTTLTLRL